jgi:hypothetical protein
MGAPLAVHFLVVVVAVIGSFAVDEDPAKVCINKSSSFFLADPPSSLHLTALSSPPKSFAYAGGVPWWS